MIHQAAGFIEGHDLGGVGPPHEVGLGGVSVRQGGTQGEDKRGGTAGSCGHGDVAADRGVETVPPKPAFFTPEPEDTRDVIAGLQRRESVEVEGSLLPEVGQVENDQAVRTRGHVDPTSQVDGCGCDGQPQVILVLSEQTNSARCGRGAGHWDRVWTAKRKIALSKAKTVSPAAHATCP